MGLTHSAPPPSPTRAHGLQCRIVRVVHKLTHTRTREFASTHAHREHTCARSHYAGAHFPPRFMAMVSGGCCERLQQKNTREHTHRARVRERGKESQTHEYFNVKRARVSCSRRSGFPPPQPNAARTRTLYVVRKYFHIYCAYTFTPEPVAMFAKNSHACQVGIGRPAAVAREIRLNA